MPPTTPATVVLVVKQLVRLAGVPPKPVDVVPVISTATTGLCAADHVHEVHAVGRRNGGASRNTREADVQPSTLTGDASRGDIGR